MQTSKTSVRNPINLYERIMPIYNILFILNNYLKYRVLLLPHKHLLLIECCHASNS